MAFIGYWIVALVGYGLALLALAWAGMAFKDALIMLRAGVDYDESGSTRGFYYTLMVGLLVCSAVAAAITTWVLGSF